MGGTFLSVLNQKNSSLKAEEKWDIYVVLLKNKKENLMSFKSYDAENSIIMS